MKYLILSLLCIFTVITACKNQIPNDGEIFNNTADTLQVKSITSLEDQQPEEHINSSAILTRDSLVYAWEERLNMIIKTTRNFKVKKVPYPNSHDQNVIDTLLTLQHEGSIFNVYQTQEAKFIKSVVLDSPDFKLDSQLYVGAKQHVLEAIIMQGISQDTVIIENMEKTFVFTFTLKDARIEQISFEGYVD